jgi:2-methylcitrate dehydratase
MVSQLARFVTKCDFDDISKPARYELKIRVLDALGCAVGALESPPARAVRAQVDEFGGRPLSTLIGGGCTAPDRAALYNGTLVRYLDFNDSYFAPGETCHPSDNLAPVLAAAESVGCSGRELLTALAVSYQVQCRLSDEAPVRAKGFDHTTQGAYAAAAGVAKALRLDQEQTANAARRSPVCGLRAPGRFPNGKDSHTHSPRLGRLRPPFWPGMASPVRPRCLRGTRA